MVSQMFCNILVCTTLWCIYHIAKAFQAIEDITGVASIDIVSWLVGF